MRVVSAGVFCLFRVDGIPHSRLGLEFVGLEVAMGQNPVPLVNINIRWQMDVPPQNGIAIGYATHQVKSGDVSEASSSSSSMWSQPSKAKARNGHAEAPTRGTALWRVGTPEVGRPFDMPRASVRARHRD